MTIALYPSIEKRFQEWITFGKANKVEPAQPPITVTISREYGCAAYPLADIIKEKLEINEQELEWPIFDHYLIDKIKENDEIPLELVENVGKRSFFVDSLASSLNNHWKTEADVYSLIVKMIYRLAQKGNAIVIGHGAAYITQELKNCYHFRLIAPFEHRVESISKRLEISHSAAKAQVTAQQNVRHNFIKRFFKKDTLDPTLFHAMFNTDRITIEEIADIILGMIPPKYQ